MLLDKPSPSIGRVNMFFLFNSSRRELFAIKLGHLNSQVTFDIPFSLRAARLNMDIRRRSRHYIALYITLSLLAVVQTRDVGFELMFKSRPEEFHQLPVFFEKPLPKWLRGTYVSMKSFHIKEFDK